MGVIRRVSGSARTQSLTELSSTCQFCDQITNGREGGGRPTTQRAMRRSLTRNARNSNARVCHNTQCTPPAHACAGVARGSAAQAASRRAPPTWNARVSRPPAARELRSAPTRGKASKEGTKADVRTYVRACVRVPPGIGPDSRDVARLVRARPPRAIEPTSRYRTCAGREDSREHQVGTTCVHTCACARVSEDRGRLARCSSPCSGKSASCDQAHRAITH